MYNQKASIHSALQNKKIVFLFYLIWTLFITGLWLPLNWSRYGNNDWDLTYSTFEISRKAYLEDHSFPTFNPYSSFGSDLIANPQAVGANLFMITVLIFGTFYGLKVSVLLAILAGIYGVRALLKLNGSNDLQKLLIPLIFCSAPYFSRHIIEAGHSNFLQFYLVPLALYLLLKTFKEYKFIFTLGYILLMSEFIVGGAPFIFIVSALISFILAIYQSLKQKTHGHWVTFASAIVFTLGISAWKILPILNFWEHSPRLVKDDDFINPLIWLNALEDNPTNTYTPHAWHEFSIGFGVTGLVYLLYHLKQIPNYKFWGIVMVFIFWLSLGNVPNKINPWYFMHHFLPVFDSLRAPSRFGFIILFGLVLGLGFINKIKYNKLDIIILISLSLSSTLSYNSISRNLSFSPLIQETPTFKSDGIEYFKCDINYPYQFKAIQSNHYLPGAYEPLHLSPVSDTPEVFSNAKLLNFSNKSIGLKTKSDTSTLALRFDNNWHTENKTAHLINKNGLLTIVLPKNDSIHLKYMNKDLKDALTLTWIAFVSMLVVLILLSAYSKNTRNLA